MRYARLQVAGCSTGGVLGRCFRLGLRSRSPDWRACAFFGETMQTGLVVAFCAVAYAGLGFATTPAKTTALDQLPPELYSHGAAINSTFVQIGSAIGPSLFVGVLSSDVLRGTAAGLSRADAYAAGFSHTLAIAIGIAAVGLVAAILFAYALRRKA